MKTVIITGGNKGIGLDITSAFLKANYKVIVGARSDLKMHKKNKNLFFKKVDLTEEKNHILLAEEAIKNTGRLDVYINNAGLSGWKPIKYIDEMFIDKLMDINLKAVIWGCKTASKYIVNGGSIINISSIAGKRGSTNNSIYCATKFGVNGITQSLAKELGKEKIRVNAICPVLVKTDGLINALDDQYSPANGNVDGFLEKFCFENSALGYLPSGKNVGEAAVFLASKNSSSITGQCINLDCGVFPQ